jgi:hypothetical protein
MRLRPPVQAAVAAICAALTGCVVTIVDLVTSCCVGVTRCLCPCLGRGGLATAGVRAPVGAAGAAGGVTAGRGAAAAGGAMPGRGAGVITRFFSTSTCTTLLRPWLKLWRTLPASTVLPSSNRPPGRRLRRLLAASCSFWSLIPWSLSNSSCSYGRSENRSRHSVTIQVLP